MLLTDNLLLNYKRCSRRTYLDVYGNTQQKDSEKDFLIKLKRENKAHINRILQSRVLFFQQPDASRRHWQLNCQQTIDLMKQGVDCIYKGMLGLGFPQWQSLAEEGLFSKLSNPNSQLILENITLLASPTLLMKQPGISKFGNWQYIPVNIKLGRRPKPEYKLIAAYHAQILAAIQEVIPSRSQLILRNGNDYNINLEYWLPNMHLIVADCLETLVTKSKPEVFISRQKCSLCHWYSYCYDTAKSQQHLSLIPGVTPRRYQDLQALGINSPQSLANISEIMLTELMEQEVARQLKQQVKSILNQQPLIKSSYNLKASKNLPTTTIELYFDIEAEPERNLDYLLGLIIRDRHNNTTEFKAFLAEHPQDEKMIWQQFLDFVALYPDAPIFHYSEYEIDTIKRLTKLYQTPKNTTQQLLSRLIDLHEKVTESVILPVESYSLKAIANWMGFYWREANGSGDQSVCWYDRWLTTSDRSLLEAILSYNEDDCLATLQLKDWLVDFLDTQKNT
ncbi:MAG: TM0106 family RecB-like putative nuclease [Pleurocapsa sp.]